MESVEAEYRKAVQGQPIGTPETPVIANTTTEPMVTVEAIRAELNAQMTAQVRWRESMLRLVSEGITDFVELGPKDVLTRLLRRIDRSANGHALGMPAAIAALASA
jgi:[acyl-carrier-protein] S-malonyltransferase